MAARAASSITSEKERDCWTSLLGTPLTPFEIVWAKVAGNLYAARWFFYLLMTIWASAIVLVPNFIFPVVLQGGTFVMLAFFVSSMGVLYSLWCKTSLKAMAATLATGIFVGGGYMFCCGICMVFAHGGGRDTEIMFAGVMPFLLAFPGIVFAEPGNGGPETIYAAYILGLLFYGIVGPALFGIAIVNFESLVGRIGRDFERHQRPPKQPVAPQTASPFQSSIVAEVVEE
jgi:ABC-type Na+ efflux pump permease subunit